MFRNICIAALVLFCISCGSDDSKEEPIPLESKSAALTTTENIVNHVEDLNAMLQFMEASALIEETFSMFEDSSMVCEPPEHVPGEEPGEPDCWEPEPEEFEVELDKVTDDIQEFLNQNVFVDSQIELEDGSSVVYLLSPDIFCDGPSEASGGGSENTNVPKPGEPADKSDEFGDEEWDEDGDDDCAQFLQDVEVRVRIVSYSEGNVDIDILFGVDQLAPLHLQIYEDKLAVEVDLAMTKAVAQLFVDTFGEDDEDVDLPEVFEGKMRAELKKDSATKYSLTYSVEENIKVGMTLDGEEFSAELGKSSMTAAVDSTAQTISWDVDFNELTVNAPYQLFIDAWYDMGEEEGDDEYPDDPPEVPADDIYDEDPETPQVAGALTLFVAGFSGAATFAATDDTVTVSGLGLGDAPSYIKKGDTALVSVSLNRDNGWAMDMTTSFDGEDLSIQTSPVMDAAVTWYLKGIESDLDEVPAFLLDETFRVLLDSDPTPSVLFVDGSDDSDGGLKVTAGKLTLSSSAAPEETVTVETGMCLMGMEDGESSGSPDIDGEEDPLPEETDDGHELLSSFVVEQCG
jgi:hypothetical protein